MLANSIIDEKQQEVNLLMFYWEIMNNVFCKYLTYCSKLLFLVVLFTVFPEIYEQVQNNYATDYANFELVIH